MEDGVDITKFNHYWILKRYNPQIEHTLFGQIAKPYALVLTNRQDNQEVISKVLSETDAFDKPIRFKEKDRLQVVLHNHSENHMDVFKFKFEYTSGQWQIAQIDEHLYTRDQFYETDAGEIKVLE